MTHELITSWQRISLSDAPFVLEEDYSILKQKRNTVVLHTNYSEYAKSSLERPKDPQFHLGLIPVPYLGDLEKATVFVLMQNPGLGASDYFGEYDVPQYRQQMIDNLQQKPNRKFPMPFMNPNVAWHGGGSYWRDRLHWLAVLLTQNRRIEYWDALSLISQQVCILQLIPYHSASFSFPTNRVKQLRSSNLVKRFVYETILPRDNVLILALRQISQWGLPDRSNIIQYRGSESRGAYLSPKSRGGKAIAGHFGILPPKQSELHRRVEGRHADATSE